MKTEIGTDLKIAIEQLQKGELVAIPTETVYGLAADGTNNLAIHKIFEAKGRPKTNPLILHFSNSEAISPYIKDFPKELEKLAELFWPGPLTLLLNKSNLVPDIITSGHDRVAVRVPAHSITLDLLKNLPFPLAAPSANLYGKISPTKTEHVFNQLKGKIPYILEGGPCNKGLESTIVGMENEKLIIYRLGSISVEDIENVLGFKPKVNINSNETPLTSGMVKHHYAPTTPLFFIDSINDIDKTNSYGFIFFQNDFMGVSNKIILSETGNLNEAARNLYNAMHTMDSQGFEKIYIERFPENELGRTINDRLKRATAKFEQ
ncbi:MAG: threonylcarbamoyl-AMP synthase [Bacteroidetes bacterium]|nr:threonylcarbamoyl-AMP synthase [Bacteroidota bacterium]